MDEHAEEKRGKISRRAFVFGSAAAALAPSTAGMRNKGEAAEGRRLDEGKLVKELTGMDAAEFSKRFTMKVKIPAPPGGRYVIHIRMMHHRISGVEAARDSEAEVRSSQRAIEPLVEAVVRANKLDGVFAEGWTSEEQPARYRDRRGIEPSDPYRDTAELRLYLRGTIQHIYPLEDEATNRRAVEAARADHKASIDLREQKIDADEWQRIRAQTRALRYGARDTLALQKIREWNHARKGAGLAPRNAVVIYAADHNFSHAVAEENKKAPTYGLVELSSKDLVGGEAMY